jgi:hypothetical protein
MSFRVITPVSMTDAMLASSSIPEPDTGETAWNSGSTYALGDRRYVASNHTMYESLQNSNTNHDPLGDTQGDVDNPPVWWLDVGRTNRWQMFNLLRNDQSIGNSPMTIVLTPGVRIDSLGLFGIVADSMSITVDLGVDEVYSYTEDLNQRDVFDWFDYFFEPFSLKQNTAVFDIPPYSTGVITVTLTSNTGSCSLGSLVIGNQTNIGNVQYGAQSDVLNFSRIDRAFDGTALLTQRRSIPKTIQRVFSDKSKTNAIRRLRTNLNAVPAVWAGIDQTNDDYFEALLILGIYKKFTIDLSYPEHTLIELEIEEI